MPDTFLQVLGLLRWSYPSNGEAFALEGETLEARRAELYADARLEERMFYLEHVILPCLAAQTDQNFRVVMLLGDRLPLKWRARVLEAVSKVRQVKPVFEAEGEQHRLVCRLAMMSHRNPEAGAVAEFRLDDDDAICVDFVEQVRRVYRQNRQLMNRQGKFCVDFVKGFGMTTGAEGVTLTPVQAPLWVASLALIYPPDHGRSLIDYPHKSLWTAMPVISIPRQIAWIRGVHSSNDSAIGERIDRLPNWKFDQAEAETILKERFGLDWPALQTAWRTLGSRSAA